MAAVETVHTAPEWIGIPILVIIGLIVLYVAIMTPSTRARRKVGR